MPTTNMKSVVRFLVFVASVAASALAANKAQAQDLVRIFVGGPSSLQRLAPYRDELDKVAGMKVEITVQPSEMTLKGIVSGLGDIAITGKPEESFARAEKSGMPKQNLEDFQWYENPPVEIQIGVHPDNSTKPLSKDEIAAILTGATMTWESVGGKKLPIKIFIAESYQSTMDSVLKHYGTNEKNPRLNIVKDKNGMLRALQREPGAIAFFTQRDSLNDFTPKYFATDIKRRSYVIAKKKMRPSAQKVYDYIKTLKFDRD